MKFSRGDVWTIAIALIALVTGVLVAMPLIRFWALPIFPLGVILLLAAGYETVPNNERWVIEIFGAYDRILNPGLNFLLRGVETIRAKQSISEQHLDLEVRQTLTQDDIKIDLNTELFFTLKQETPAELEQAVKDATYGVEADADGTTEGAIAHFAHATLRSIVGSKNFDWVTDHQADINHLVKEEMDKGVAPWGRIIRRHLIKELLPQPEIAAALLKELTSRKNKIATEVDADAKKYADIAAAEAVKQTRILAAQAQAEEQIQDARGEAAGIVERGKAMANEDGRLGAQYNLAEQAIKALQDLAQKTTTLVIPASLADVAGITETVKKLLAKPSPGGSLTP